eukprot:TRINITY_DN9563_c0_g1_i2.p1 TRINITY_DN9563_c0_g1~~TRINITY_DN9563_c0_g1_i2.p1  ORF type:complete len:463 (+),score=96.64 TRINITY_DN9563_c0_g1_i2:93-1391(+)
MSAARPEKEVDDIAPKLRELLRQEFGAVTVKQGPAVRLTPLELDGAACPWDSVPTTLRVRAPAQAAGRRAPRKPESPLRVVTWNVFFGEHKQKRMQGLLQELVQNKVEVACLQEMTPIQMVELVKNDFVRSQCWIAVGGNGPLTRAKNGYGVAVVSTLPMTSACLWSMDTNMGRHLLQVTLDPGWGTQLSVGCVHLESLGHPRLRRLQLQSAAEVLQQSGMPAILCGDFNFGDAPVLADPTCYTGTVGSWNAERGFGFIRCDETHARYGSDVFLHVRQCCGELSRGQQCAFQVEAADRGPSAVLATVLGRPREFEADILTRLSGWTDAWLAVRPSDPGFSYDTERNKMFVRERRREKERYDRVLVHSSAGGGLRAVNASLVGTQPIRDGQRDPAGGPLYPSDHFGVMVDIVPTGARPISPGRGASRVLKKGK